jgi:hypothetical protein
MFEKCIRLVDTVRLGEPAHLFDLAERIRRYVSGGTPQIVQASSPIDELRREMPVQDTYFVRSPLHHMWEREFQLKYGHHGHGKWR